MDYGKECSGGCGYLPLSAFHKKNRRNLLPAQCRDCVNGVSAAWKKANPGLVQAYNRESYKNRRAYFLINAARERAAAKQLPFDLDEHYEALKKRIDGGVCEITGLCFSDAYEGTTAYSPSLDRIEASRGYVYTNVRVIVWSLNAAFGAWGENDFEKVARAWLGNRKDS